MLILYKGQTYERGENGQWVLVGGDAPIFPVGNGIAKTGNDQSKSVNGVPSSVLENSRAASALVAARGLVQHGVGKADIDEKIGITVGIMRNPLSRPLEVDLVVDARCATTWYDAK